MHILRNLSIILALTSSLFFNSNANASVYDLTCAGCMLEGSFTMRNPDGTVASTGPLDIPGLAGEFSFNLFSGGPEIMAAHSVTLYTTPGTYSFDSMGDINTPPVNYDMTVNPGQVGMFFLFDWSANTDIDVINVFDVNTVGGTTFYTPVDVDGTGVTGFKMVDGPFRGFELSMEFTATVPVPAALWLFMSGLAAIGCVGRARIDRRQVGLR